MSIFLVKKAFESPIIGENPIKNMQSRISRIIEHVTNKISVIIAAIVLVSLAIFSYCAQFFTSYICSDRSKNIEIKNENNNKLSKNEEPITDNQAKDNQQTVEFDLKETKNTEGNLEEVSLINQAFSAPSLLDDLLDRWITRGSPGEDRLEAANRIKQFAANKNNDDHKILDLSRLGLKTLPQIFTNTEECFRNRMMYLNLRNNQLKTIPKDFGNLTNLKELDLQDNPLIKIPSEVLGLARINKTNSSERLTLLVNQIDMLDVLNDLYGKYFSHYNKGFFYIQPPMFKFYDHLYLDSSNRNAEQMTFDTTSKTLISDALKILDDRAKKTHNEIECLNDSLSLFAKGREAIAKKCDSNNSFLFGLSRIGRGEMTTSLDTFGYENYGKRFSSFVLLSLEKKEELGEEAIPYEKRFDPIDGYSFSYTVNVIDSEKRLSLMNGRFHHVDPNNPDQLIFSSFIEFKGNQIPLSRYILVDQRHSDSSEIWSGMIVHQEDHLIQTVLDGPIMDMFTAAISWNREEGVESLVKTMALFRFFFAHAMPFARGSAAIGEWLEKAIYLYHGFIDFDHEKSRLADLEALTLPLPDYLNEYPKTITGVSE